MIASELFHRSHHYSILVFGVSLLLGGFLIVDTHEQRVMIALILSAYYSTWGLLTHRKEIRSPRLVLEYVAVSALAWAILVSISTFV